MNSPQTRSFYAQMSEQWKLEQDQIAHEIDRHLAADHSYLDEGVRLIELAQGPIACSSSKSRTTSAGF